MNKDSKGAGSPSVDVHVPKVHMVILALLSIYILFPSIIDWSDHKQELRGDSLKYFAWLQTVFEDGDLHFGDDYKELNPKIAPKHLKVMPTGYVHNVFPIGAPLLWSPFYLTGKAYFALFGSGERADELETLIVFARFGTRFYVAITLFLIYLIVRRFFSANLALLGTVACFLGTAFYYYGLFHTANAQGMSAFAASLFIWYCLRTGPNRKLHQWIVAGLLAGIILLCRPHNFVIVIWLAFEQVPNLVETIRKKGPVLKLFFHYVLGAVSMVLVFVPQIILWSIIFGPFKTPLDFHANKMFWTSPEIVNILFSSRHGLFSWHPLTYLAVIGLFVLLWKNFRLAIAALVLFFVMTYLNASISDWWGGGSFGMRRFVSISFVFAIGIAAMAQACIQLFRKRPQVVIYSLLAIFIWWNLDLAQSFRKGLIETDSPPAMEMIAAEQTDRWLFGYLSAFPGNLIQSLSLGVDSYREADWIGSHYLFNLSKNLNGVIEPEYPSFRDGFSAIRTRRDVNYRTLQGPRGVVLLNRKNASKHDGSRTLVIDAAYVSHLKNNEIPVVKVSLNGKRIAVLTSRNKYFHLWGLVHLRPLDWKKGINKLELKLYVGDRKLQQKYRGDSFKPDSEESLKPNDNNFKLRVSRLTFFPHRKKNLDFYTSQFKQKNRREK